MDTILTVSRLFFILTLLTALVSLVMSLFTQKKSYGAFFLSLLAALLSWSVYSVSLG